MVLKVARYRKVQWWFTPRRWRMELPIRVKVSSALGMREFQAQTYDISKAGLFIPGVYIPPGTPCFISLSLKGLTFVQCQAKVVRSSQGMRGGYPAGIGISLRGLSSIEQWKLHSFLQDCR